MIIVMIYRTYPSYVFDSTDVLNVEMPTSLISLLEWHYLKIATKCSGIE
jgi:hypothetical protein